MQRPSSSSYIGRPKRWKCQSVPPPLCSPVVNVFVRHVQQMERPPHQVRQRVLLFYHQEGMDYRYKQQRKKDVDQYF